MKSNFNWVLVLGVLLLGYGFIEPVITKNLNPVPVSVTRDFTDLKAPEDPKTLELCRGVIKTFVDSGSPTRKSDALKLASLYLDLSNLISLSGEEEVIKNTLEVREANRIAGFMLKTTLVGKYKDLSSKTNDVVMNGLGDDDIALSKEVREIAVKTFRDLSWACYQGSL
jgi:hypothetical protein